MTTPSTTIALTQLYESTEQGLPLGDEFESWLARSHKTRGQLERKKKLPDEQLHALLPGIENIELERYIFCVEVFLTVHALEHLRFASDDMSLADSMHPIAMATRLSSLALEAAPALEQATHEHLVATLKLVVNDASLPFVDLFQNIRMELVPRAVRHAIGSFYTPQWLARHVLRSTGFRWERGRDLLKESVLDPSSGSGVFLVAAAEELRQAVINQALDAHKALEMIHSRLHGIEIELVPSLQSMANLAMAAFQLAHGARQLVHPLSFKIHNLDALEANAHVGEHSTVVGNPPWVNWEYMPSEFREKHTGLWRELNIFDPNKKLLAFSKEDISALFVAKAVNSYLSPEGRFGFLVPESLLKSTLNHSGFRRFEVGLFPEPYEVNQVDDFVAVRPFEGVANRTIALYGRKGSETNYPVTFNQWHRIERSSMVITGSGELRGSVDFHQAQPSDAQDLSSSWSTATGSELEIYRTIEGLNTYQGRTGVFTGGANAVYHLRPISNASGNIIRVRNITERAKRAAPEIEADLETSFIYPFLRGRDIKQWGSECTILTLLPHTAETKMYPVSEDEVQAVAPRTFEYLSGFRDILEQRKGFSTWEKAFLERGFYACQRIGDYTFADWKVGWKYISKTFTTDILGPAAVHGLDEKPVIPNEKIMYVSCHSREEAYYLGGIFASAIVRSHIESRMVSTQISPKIIAGINIPAFDKKNPSHVTISKICEEAYITPDRQSPNFTKVITNLETLVGTLWEVPRETCIELLESNPLFP